ncbi:nucleolar complex protein 2 [Oratosquilla oratoria]|uniref:nucleolar complex protein 2 n=1 Tax=Oratosquilla oratoria TaxID=337810 RepID=UPI003F75BD9F
MKTAKKTQNSNPMKRKLGKNKKKQKVPGAKNKNKDLKELSVDDMFSYVQDDEDDSGSDDDMLEPTPAKDDNIMKKGAKEDEESEEDESEELDAPTKLSRKEYLEKLKKNDPDFYNTIMQSEDVMGLQSSDDEDDDDDERGGKIFQPPEELEEDSDVSDIEEEGMQKRGDNMVTASMIKDWEEELAGPQPLNAFREVEQAFLAAIESIKGSEEEAGAGLSSRYTIEGPQIFNSMVRLCLRHVAPALQKILQLKNPNDDPAKSKRWCKMRNYIKPYLKDLAMLCERVAEPAIAESVLSRGIIPLLGYYAGHPSVCRVLLRRLITFWGVSDKKIRVLAFIAILRLVKALPQDFLDWTLKRLYLSYVRNCRFTSPSTWGMIDFMRLSLVELYAMDHTLAYRQAFVYIRQMAFHLRNAIMVKKKEKIQLVYNWQFIHCLHLWAELLGKTHPSEALQALIYPLTQIAIGTLKLLPTAKYHPLTFHVCNILTQLSRSTGTFIPVLPFLLTVLNDTNLNKQHKKASVRPFNWLCMLKLSKSQVQESAFKDGVVDNVYDGMISYMAAESASIGFPELAVPAVLQLKGFLKKCKVPNYTKKVKQLVAKITENSSFIEERRKGVSFSISDVTAAKEWEIATRQAGTPLEKYYNSWRKIREKEQLRGASQSNKMDDYGLPVVRRKELEEKHKAKDKEEMKELFESDTDEDDDDDERFLSKKGKTQNKEVEEGDDDDDIDDDDSIKDDENVEESNMDGEEIDEDEAPPAKKTKKAHKIESVSMDDMNDDKEGVSGDVVQELRLSDLEDEDEDDDDFGVGSDDSDE